MTIKRLRIATVLAALLSFVPAATPAQTPVRVIDVSLAINAPGSGNWLAKLVVTPAPNKPLDKLIERIPMDTNPYVN